MKYLTSFVSSVISFLIVTLIIFGLSHIEYITQVQAEVFYEVCFVTLVAMLVGDFLDSRFKK